MVRVHPSPPFLVYLGGVAQLARALDLHSRGRGFDSHLLHQILRVIALLFHIVNMLSENY